MTFTLPYPPSANVYWRFTARGVYVSAAAKAYKLLAASEAVQQGVTLLSGPVVLRLDIYRPRAAGDLSNRIKVLEDALIGVAFEDDDQVIDIRARRFDQPKEKGVKRAGYVLVSVEAVNHVE